MAIKPRQRLSLLSSQARVQSPWVKVVIGSYSFGVFDRKTREMTSDGDFYVRYNVQYPRFIQSLNITKINGQVNQYTLQMDYPVRIEDDPNFIEKVLSSVSKTRKIVFSYGDASTPSYVYKNEEAIITNASQSFNIQGGVISYTIEAVSNSTLGTTGSFSFPSPGIKKPSDIIKEVLNNPRYGLRSLFTGMTPENIPKLIAGGDKAVKIDMKTNISPIDYIRYLTSCMVPAGSTTGNTSKDLYIFTLHDDTVFDGSYNQDDLIVNNVSASGPYFKVTRTSNVIEQADAYEIDIGYNTSTIVSNFQIDNRENFSLFFDYNSELAPEQYSRRLNNKGQWEDVYAPMVSSKNDRYHTRPEDVTWFTQVTKYPISASIKIQGLLRPAQLMQYVRLNVVFPGGKKHISSGLYIVTKQNDELSGSGYHTTLGLTRIAD